MLVSHGVVGDGRMLPSRVRGSDTIHGRMT